MGIPFDYNPMGVTKHEGGGMPTSGLVFYAPLASNSASTAKTGQALTYRTTPTESSIGGINCLYFDGSSSQGIYSEDVTNLPTGNHSFTMSVWIYNQFTSPGNAAAVTMGTNQNYKCMMLGVANNNGGWKFGSWGKDIFVTPKDTNKWHNLLQTYNGSACKCYVDGVLKKTTSYTTNITYGGIYIGNIVNLYDYWKGYIAAARIYDRVLTDEEIALLATEYNPEGTITASDLSFSLYQKNETYGITYTSTYPPTFEIIEGTLPNTISFNTSTGKFTGKGLTDADHTYNLKVRITANNSTPAEVNVTIHTYKTARISLTGATWDFITEASSSKSISYTSDESISEWSIDSGTLPSGVTFANGTFTSNGQQTADETQTVIVRAKSANNQTGVTSSYTLRVKLNQLALGNRTIVFYTGKGQTSRSLTYTTQNMITPVWSIISGTLPAGITFSDGTFTSDATQIADETQDVGVQVASSTGRSASASAVITLSALVGDPPAVPDDYVFYWSMTDKNDTSAETGQEFTKNNSIDNVLTNDIVDGIHCITSTNDRAYKYYKCSQEGLPSGNSPRTISWWQKVTTVENNTIVKWGSIGASAYKWWRQQASGGVDIAYYSLTRLSTDSQVLNVWHHMCFVFTNTSYSLYIDGELIGTSSSFASSVDTEVGNNDNLFLFGDNHDGYTRGSVTALRIYDRVLNGDEISGLAAEFTPTT